MPFVDQASAIAALPEHRGNGCILWQEVGPANISGITLWTDLHALDATGSTLIVAYSGLAIVASGHQGTT